MKNLSLRLLIMCLCMSSTALLHALRPQQRADIATLTKQLESNTIEPKKIWQAIKNLNISSNDYKDPSFKKLNALAVEKLNNANFTLNGRSIPVSTNLATLSADDQPDRPFERVTDVEVEEPVTPTFIKPAPPAPPAPKPVPTGYKPGPGTQAPKKLEDVELSFEDEEEIEKTPEIEELTLAKGLEKLKDLEDQANAATNMNLIPGLYKRFYTLQDHYFGLSGAIVTGRLWWQKVTSNDKKAFADASAKTLKAIRDKELALSGDTTFKLTPEEAKEFIKKVNASNPIEALRSKKISLDQYNEIIKIRNEIFTWKKRQEKGLVLPSDKDRILKAVTQVKSLKPYAGEFATKLANELDIYVNTDPKFKQAESLLGGMLGQEKTLLDMIFALSKRISPLMGQAKDMPSVAWFKADYQKIMSLFDNMANSQQTEQLKKEIRTPLYAITDYRNLVAFQRINLLDTLRKLKKENKDTTEVSSQIDKITYYLTSIDNEYQAFAKKILEKDFTAAADVTDLKGFETIVAAITSKEQMQNLMLELCNNFGNKITKISLGILKDEYPNEIGYNQFANKYRAGFEAVLQFNDAKIIDLLNKRYDQLKEASINVMKAAIIQYRDSHELAKLHLIATGASSDISNAIEKMKTAKLDTDKSLNFIANAAAELSPNMTDKEKEEVATLLFTNFAYVLAAFDSFRYALFTEGVKADAPKTWFAWFSSFFRSGAQKQAFDKLTKIVDVFMESIVNTIEIHTQLFARPTSSIMSNYQPYKEFNAGTIGGQLSLNTYFKAQKIDGFSKPDGQYKYAYTLVGNNIKFPGKVEVVGAIGAGTESNKLTDIHRKSMTYRALLDLDKQIISLAYGNVAWQKRLTKTFEYQKLQDIVNTHLQTLDALKTQVAQLKASEKSADNFTKIAELEEKIKQEIAAYEGKRDTQQKAYEEAYAEYIAAEKGEKEIVVTKQ